MLTYAKMMENYIKERIYFTCQDVMDITNTTCPHGVIRELRRKFKITAERISRNGKNFNLYKFEGAL